MNSQSDFNLPILSSWYKKKFLGYASQVLEAQQKMTSSKGKNILHYTLRKKRKHERMSHYPKETGLIVVLAHNIFIIAIEKISKVMNMVIFIVFCDINIYRSVLNQLL
ncbi:hypothetical protein PGH43_06525 [Legionella pneumophila 130b]|nr:hypothetical protein PGH43_06525 [Legionella pneumophila 130b]